MINRFESLRLPTERQGVILKTATILDDEAWLLAKRHYKHRSRPRERNAPEYYYEFSDLRRRRSLEDPQKLNMGIWDTDTYGLIVFAGFVSLQTNTNSRDFGRLDCNIVEQYRRSGYATTALQAIMKFGREYLDIDTFKGVVPKSNQAGHILAAKLEFEVAEEMHRRFTYILTPPAPIDTPLAAMPDSKAA